MPNLQNMITEAYQDEVTADLFYSQILVLTTHLCIIEPFVEARLDERRHARMIEKLLVGLNGKVTTDFSPAPPEFTSLREAVQKALEAELEDIEFYQRIINSTDNEIIRDTFWYIRQDEIVHAKKFAAVLMELEQEEKEKEEEAEEEENHHNQYINPFDRYNLKNL